MSEAKDPNNNSFQISDIIDAISGSGSQNSNIKDALSKFGGRFGLDQNADSKVDISDAVGSVTKKKGIFGGIFGKLFGK